MRPLGQSPIAAMGQLLLGRGRMEKTVAWPGISMIGEGGAPAAVDVFGADRSWVRRRGHGPAVLLVIMLRSPR